MFGGRSEFCSEMLFLLSFLTLQAMDRTADVALAPESAHQFR
jgi:hypothetical protein